MSKSHWLIGIAASILIIGGANRFADYLTPVTQSQQDASTTYAPKDSLPIPIATRAPTEIPSPLPTPEYKNLTPGLNREYRSRQRFVQTERTVTVRIIKERARIMAASIPGSNDRQLLVAKMGKKPRCWQQAP